MECDFCGVYVECEDGSAFCDGTLYSDLDNVACNDCCGQLKYGKEQSNDQTNSDSTNVHTHGKRSIFYVWLAVHRCDGKHQDR